MPSTDRHALHLFTIMIGAEQCGVTRDEMLMHLHRENIGSGVHYRSIPSFKVYRERFGFKAEECPVAWQIGEQTLSLPLSPKLTDDDVSDVIAAVHRALST
jgi:dTDP-4-amino-4,6-dideoxygalactose transaminase